MSATLNKFGFFQKFPNEEAARNFLETHRWAGETPWGHGGAVNLSERKDHKPMAYRYKSCRKHFQGPQRHDIGGKPFNRLCNHTARRQHSLGMPGFWPQPALFPIPADFGLRECWDR